METKLKLGDITNPDIVAGLLNQDPSFNRALFEKCLLNKKRNIDRVTCLLAYMSDEQAGAVAEAFCKAVFAPVIDGRKFRIVVCSIMDAAAAMAPRYFPEDDPNGDVLEGSCTHNLIVGSLLGKLSIQERRAKPELLKK